MIIILFRLKLSRDKRRGAALFKRSPLTSNLMQLVRETLRRKLYPFTQ